MSRIGVAMNRENTTDFSIYNRIRSITFCSVKTDFYDPDTPHSWRTFPRVTVPFQVGEGALDILFGRFLSAILVETTTRFQKALPLEGHPAKNEKERTKVLASEGKACEDDTVSPPGVIESRCCLCSPFRSSPTP
ncbi:hypothetical protein NPIL_635841 [Nephila pilipes]|uniref:Uncharacterized protein n=1 Tax=Nephila pilipes TaxID=299642 RepID=A0A8X6IR18_NEPPI|nr:hypothetical protein NPIL_635841 [Nephila pilipes]